MFSAKRMFCLVLGVSTLAWAEAPRPVVMPFPLELKRAPQGFSKEDAEGIQRDYTRLLRSAGVALPDFAKFDAALKDLKRLDCEREDECLVQLSKKADALYALYASIDYTLDGAVVASGRVVRDDGKAVRAAQTVKLAKGKDPFKDIARNALTQLFAALKVSELEAVKPVEAKVVKDPIGDPPPPPPPLVFEDSGAGQRSAGKGLVYAGAGVALVGAVVAGVGAGVGYGAKLNGDLASNPAMARQAATGQTLATVGFVGLGVGALTAGVGAILWGTAAPPPAQVSVVPIVGGAVLQVGGSL
jgi:hypothetical protein